MLNVGMKGWRDVSSHDFFGAPSRSLCGRKVSLVLVFPGLRQFACIMLNMLPGTEILRLVSKILLCSAPAKTMWGPRVLSFSRPDQGRVSSGGPILDLDPA